MGKLDSLLGCLVLALEHGRSDDALYDPYFPDIAVMARVMVQRVRNALDSVTLTHRLLASPDDEAGGRERAV